MSMSCTRCNKNIIKAKLGRCQSCMITTFVCSLLGLLGNLWVGPNPPLTTPTLALKLFTFSFMTLFALHVAFATYYKVTGNIPEDD